MQDWTVLCVIAGVHGVRGAVKIKPFTQYPEDILAYGSLCDAQGKPFDIRITGSSKGQLIGNIEGLTDRNDAEKLRGTELGVSASLLPDTEEDSFYINELVGLRVLQDGDEVGEVKSVQNFGAGDLVEVVFKQGKPEFFAFTHATFPHIDVSANTVTFCRPETIVAKKEESE